MQQHLLLAAAWLLWCALHSVLISDGWMRWMRRQLGERVAYYRLAYVLFSTVSLGAVLLAQQSVSSPVLWVWPPSLVPLQWGGLTLAGFLFLVAARQYDQPYFLGLRQLRDHRAGRDAGAPAFTKDGILQWIRHPYYSAGMLFLLCWGDISPANLILKSIGIGYFIVGAFLEERKLIALHGDAYRRYREEVPMFLPNPFRMHRDRHRHD